MRQDGRLNQAESLASTHGKAAKAAITAAAKARAEAPMGPLSCHFEAPGAEFGVARMTSEIEPAHELPPYELPVHELPPGEFELADPQRGGIDRQTAPEDSTEPLLHEQVEALAEQLAAAQQETAEAEARLVATYEQLDLQENENCSLKTSLELLIGENSRLSSRITECEASCAAVEKKLEQMQLDLFTLSVRNTAAERKVTEAIAARDAAENKLELLRNLLRLTDRQVQELEQSRSTLIEGTTELLKTFESRDTILARSEARNKVLVERIAQLEAEARLTSKPEQLEEIKRQWARLEHSLAESARKTMRSNGAAPQRDAGNGTAPNGPSERTQKRAAQTLLSGTITFVNAGSASKPA